MDFLNDKNWFWDELRWCFMPTTDALRKYGSASNIPPPLMGVRMDNELSNLVEQYLLIKAKLEHLNISRETITTFISETREKHNEALKRLSTAMPIDYESVTIVDTSLGRYAIMRDPSFQKDSVRVVAVK